MKAGHQAWLVFGKGKGGGGGSGRKQLIFFWFEKETTTKKRSEVPCGVELQKWKIILVCLFCGFCGEARFAWMPGVFYSLSPPPRQVGLQSNQPMEFVNGITNGICQRDLYDPPMQCINPPHPPINPTNQWMQPISQRNEPWKYINPPTRRPIPIPPINQPTNRASAAKKLVQTNQINQYCTGFQPTEQTNQINNTDQYHVQFFLPINRINQINQIK